MELQALGKYPFCRLPSNVKRKSTEKSARVVKKKK